MVHSTFQHPPSPSPHSHTFTGFIRGILRGVRYAKLLRVLFLHRRSPSWTTLVLYSRVVFIFNEPTNCLYILYNVHWEGGGEGGGGQREGTVEGQQYTSIVPSSMWGNSSQAGSKIRTMSECISSKLQRFLNLRYWSTGGDT
jgi:hypothetical protein